MSSYSYNKLICLPTKVIKDSSTLLDNIYSNVPMCMIQVQEMEVLLHSMRCSDDLQIFTFRSISETVAFEAYRKKGTVARKTFLDLEKS